MDKCNIYRHGDPAEGYYPLSWSPIYGCWSFGEPGFSDTTDPAYGFPPEVQLSGMPNVDYQIWFEILDLTPDFKIRTDDGTWLTQVGDRCNLSNWPEHHVHMKYRAYVPEDPPPDYPFYVTYVLVDDIGPYQDSEPFVCVFNVPAPAVEATTPLYRQVLPSRCDAELTFTFHRPITVVGGPPVTITDETTQTEDYYTGYFDYQVSPDGMILTLNQVAGVLPGEMWLQASLAEHVKDAADPNQPAIPHTHFVRTIAAGDLDVDGDVDYEDFSALADCLAGPGLPLQPECELGDLDCDDDADLADFAAFQAAFTGGACERPAARGGGPRRPAVAAHPSDGMGTERRRERDTRTVGALGVLVDWLTPVARRRQEPRSEPMLHVLPPVLTDCQCTKVVLCHASSDG